MNIFNLHVRLYFFLYIPCNGMNPNKANIPISDETPISCHKKYVTTIVSKGPIHKKCRKNIAISKRFTSFDNKFTT